MNDANPAQEGWPNVSIRLRAASRAGVSRDDVYRLYGQELRPFIEQAFGWDEAFQRRRFDQTYPDVQLSVIEQGDAFAGALVCVPRHGSIHISLLILQPEFQGQGIGRSVMEDLFQNAAQAGLKVSLSCFKANHRALAFYGRLGMRVVGEDPHFVDLAGPGPEIPSPTCTKAPFVLGVRWVSPPTGGGDS